MFDSYHREKSSTQASNFTLKRSHRSRCHIPLASAWNWRFSDDVTCDVRVTHTRASAGVAEPVPRRSLHPVRVETEP